MGRELFQEDSFSNGEKSHVSKVYTPFQAFKEAFTMQYLT